MLYLASFHFWFPVQLKRYHGAEHMAFTIRRQKLEKESWMEADIRNAGCSTAAAVTGCFFLMGMLPFHGFDFHGVIITAAALSAAFITEVLRRRFPERLALITRLSGRLQQACTTAMPDRLMVSLAVRSLEELIKHEKTPVSVKTR
nr:DUF1385 domain-containing protein [Alkalicoccus luteus]